MSLRKFAEPMPSIADDWFKNPIQNISVNRLGDFSQTADGACRVEFSGTKVGYVKPKPVRENKVLVAREKIAADLGHILDLPVAPVVIRMPQPPDWPFYSCMSLACLPNARPWGAAPQPAAIDSAANALEGLRVFWTWIADCDHNSHPENVVYEVRDNSCQVLGIDHAYSLCHNYDANNLLNVPPSNGYGTEARPDSGAVRKDVAEKILSEGIIHAEDIVSRLADILTKDEQTRILHILTARLELILPWAK